MSLFNQLGSAIREYGRFRTTVRELNSLSDHELADIGVSRFDIRSIAASATAREFTR